MPFIYLDSKPLNAPMLAIVQANLQKQLPNLKWREEGAVIIGKPTQGDIEIKFYLTEFWLIAEVLYKSILICKQYEKTLDKLIQALKLKVIKHTRLYLSFNLSHLPKEYLIEEATSVGCYGDRTCIEIDLYKERYGVRFVWYDFSYKKTALIDRVNTNQGPLVKKVIARIIQDFCRSLVISII